MAGGWLEARVISKGRSLEKLAGWERGGPRLVYVQGSPDQNSTKVKFVWWYTMAWSNCCLVCTNSQQPHFFVVIPTSFSFLSWMEMSLALLAAFCFLIFSPFSHSSSFILMVASSFIHSASISFSFSSSSFFWAVAADCSWSTWSSPEQNTRLTISLPSSKSSTFSQPFKEKCIREVVRIGSTIIFDLSKLILCDHIW